MRKDRKEAVAARALAWPHPHRQAGRLDLVSPHPRRGSRRREDISRAKGPMLAAVRHILAQRVEFCPLSDRSIHYALLNDPALRHAAKPHSVYANDRASYHDLTDPLTWAWPNG